MIGINNTFSGVFNNGGQTLNNYMNGSNTGYGMDFRSATTGENMGQAFGRKNSDKPPINYNS